MNFIQGTIIGLIWGGLVFLKLPKAYHGHFWLILFGGCVVIGVVWHVGEGIVRRIGGD